MCVCPLLQVCVCVSTAPGVCVCVSTAPGVCVYLDGSNTFHCTIVCDKKIKKYIFFFLPITDYGKMLKYRDINKPIYRSIST